jgi:hypothetical protein
MDHANTGKGNELERRLREIVRTHLPTATRDSDDVTMTVRSLKALLGQAARIGAELEREACAEVAIQAGAKPVDGGIGVARAIRARGGK